MVLWRSYGIEKKREGKQIGTHNGHMALPESATSGAAPILLLTRHKADVSPSGFLPKCRWDWLAKFCSCPHVRTKWNEGNNETKESICVNVFARKSTGAALQAPDLYEKVATPKKARKLLNDSLKHFLSEKPFIPFDFTPFLIIQCFQTIPSGQTSHFAIRGFPVVREFPDHFGTRA